MSVKNYYEYINENVIKKEDMGLDWRLHLAVKLGNVNEVKELLNAGADIESEDEQGWTPLTSACGHGNQQMVEILLKLNAKTEHSCKYTGSTPLMISCMNGYVDIAQILLDYGADTGAKDNSGLSTLHNACCYSKVGIVKLLLNNGADIEMRTDTKNGIGRNTPIMVAIFWDNDDVVKLLLEYGANIKTHNSTHQSPLDFKCKGVWKQKYTQELIITGQPHNIKFFHDKIGILLSLKKKYKEVIEMSELGIFG